MTTPLIQVFPTSCAKPQAIVAAKRLHRGGQDDMFTQHGSQLQLIALILILIVWLLFLFSHNVLSMGLSEIDSLQMTRRRLGLPGEGRPHRKSHWILIFFKKTYTFTNDRTLHYTRLRQPPLRHWSAPG